MALTRGQKVAAVFLFEDIWPELLAKYGCHDLFKKVQDSTYKMLKDDVAKANLASTAFGYLENVLKRKYKEAAATILTQLLGNNRSPNPADVIAACVTQAVFDPIEKIRKDIRGKRSLIKQVGSARSAVWESHLVGLGYKRRS